MSGWSPGFRYITGFLWSFCIDPMGQCPIILLIYQKFPIVSDFNNLQIKSQQWMRGVDFEEERLNSRISSCIGLSQRKAAVLKTCLIDLDLFSGI